MTWIDYLAMLIGYAAIGCGAALLLAYVVLAWPRRR